MSTMATTKMTRMMMRMMTLMRIRMMLMMMTMMRMMMMCYLVPSSTIQTQSARSRRSFCRPEATPARAIAGCGSQPSRSEAWSLPNSQPWECLRGQVNPVSAAAPGGGGGAAA